MSALEIFWIGGNVLYGRNLFGSRSMRLKVFSQEAYASSEFVRVVVVGQLVVDTRQEFKRMFETFLVNGMSHFVIDMSQCNFFDSSGVGVLLWANRTVAERGGVVKLLDVSKELAEFLHMIKLDEVFNIECSQAV